VILTLAGHVDHGKSSLVRALTGVDMDRLAEEKRRGLTIDLGFAYADIGGHRIGFVDVPGHQRFIHNMVAGVASRQTALIVVAADDGVMPQTREHVTILDLLGIERGFVAVTKCDRVDEARCRRVENETLALLATTGIAPIGVVRTAIGDTSSIARLRDAIGASASHDASRASDEGYRLAVDRAFNLRGVGLVVTGTVHSGEIETGANAVVAPGGRPTRIRGMRVQDRDATRATAGDRCALQLSGVELADVRRGDWIVSPPALAPTRAVVVDLRVATDAPRSIRHGLRVHVYHATSHCEGRIAQLELGEIAAGERRMVELLLDEALNPKHGDKIVLRDHGLEHTLGGGTVVDIIAVARGRRSRARMARLAAQAAATPHDALRALLATGAVDLEHFRANWNLSADHVAALATALPTVRLERAGRVLIEDAQRWRDWSDALFAQISAIGDAGLRRDALALPKAAAALRDKLVQALIASRRIEESDGALRLPGRRAALSEADARLLERIEAQLVQAAQPPSVGDIAKALKVPLPMLRQTIERVNREGRLVAVSESRLFTREQVERCTAIALALAQRRPAGFTVRDFRDESGIGRNLVVELLEFFDARGFTRRYGDLRKVVGEGPLQPPRAAR
jgi:selenocysteine-specific elongation factor